MTRYLAIALAAALTVVGCKSKRNGPEPAITSVTPNMICTAQFENSIEISGDGFSPAVTGALTDSPKVLMPKVWLVPAQGEEILVPEAGVSLKLDTDTSDTDDSLTAKIPIGLVPPTAAGELEAVYGVKVVNPNDNSDVLDAALTVVPPPSLSKIEPVSGPQGTTVTVTLTGTGFRQGLGVTLDSNPVVAGANVQVVSATTATADLDLTGVAVGKYGVTVENTEGCSATLANAFEVTEPVFFELIGIDPPFGWTGADTTVTILSNGAFVSTPTVEMRASGVADAEPIQFERVAFLDESTLTAVVPAGHPVGLYDVTVINPSSDGSIGIMEEGFRVVSQPVPLVIAVVPGGGTTQDDTPVSIYGENFRNPVKIELIDENDDVAVTLDSISPVSSNRIDATFPTTTMSAAPYLVRVFNTDENTYFTYSGFLVTNPSGNLHDFTESTQLTTGRRMLAGAFAGDDLGNRYVYAIGGDTGEGGDVLGSLELSQLSRFGQLSEWQEQRYQLNVPRKGASAIAAPVYDPQGSPYVPVKTYIYVIGGVSDDGDVLSSIERAVVLSAADAPKATSIEASVGSGTLGSGTWYYKVSAVLEASDPDNPGGETLPSDEAIATLSADGSISLSWDAVEVNGAPVAAYRIYRTDEANGASQTEHLIDEVTATSYVDNGAKAGTGQPLFAGATGVFEIDDSELGTPRWGHQSVGLHDDSGDLFVYTLGGKQDVSGGVLGSVEWATLGDDGSLGAFSATGSADMNQERAFFSAVVEDSNNVTSYQSDGSRLWAIGGIDSSGLTIDSLERSEVTTGGGNGAWTTIARNLQRESAGIMSVIANEKLFVMGGAETADDIDFSGITGAGSDTAFSNQGDITGSINSTAESLTAPRALGQVVQGSGFIYFIGGTSDGTDALSTTERTY